MVILVQENRSFDHYFGRFKGVRGFDDQTVKLPDGVTSIFQQPDPANDPGNIGTNPPYTPPVNPPAGYLRPFHIDTHTVTPPDKRPGECTDDVEHQWAGQHRSWDRGEMDAWVSSHERSQENGVANGRLTMGYYERFDLELYYALADNFTVCDNYYCSVIGGTDINRLYTIAGRWTPTAGTGAATGSTPG